MSVSWIWSGKAAEFKQDAEYVAARALVLGETSLQPGDPFDNKAVSVRRLRQLHDRRQIALKSRWDRYWKERAAEGAEEQPDPIGTGENDPNVQSPEPGHNPGEGTGEQSGENDPATQEQPGEAVEVSASEPAQDEPASGDAEQPATGANAEAMVKHFGFGKFGVMLGEEQIAGPMTKAEAQIEALKLNS